MVKFFWQAEHVLLRAFEEKDIEMYVEQRNASDSMLEWYHNYIRIPSSTAEIKREFENAIKELSNQCDQKFLVIETLDGKYVGEINIWFTDRKYGLFKYGIFLKGEFRGKKYAKEALIIVMDYYFNELNYQKAIATVYGYNYNSQKFHEHFGFTKEGILRNEIFSRGKYHDILYYGLLRHEFNNLHKHFNLIPVK